MLTVSKALVASTAPLEILFFTCLFLSMLGTYLDLPCPPLAICLVALSVGLLLLLWPKGESQTFAATRSAYAKYKVMLLELCALVYIMCAALSLYARFRARNFRSSAMLVLLREQAITSIWSIDLIACAAIVVSHLTGHHDICDRVHRRVLWFGTQLQRFSGGLCDVLFQMLQEPDLERQPVGLRVGVLDLPAPRSAILPKRNDRGMGIHQEEEVHKLVDGLDGHSLHERFRKLRSLSMSPESYSFLHQELGSISALLRWTALRDRYVYHRPPMQDFFSLAASQARGSSIKTARDEMTVVGPPLQHPPRHRRTSTRRYQPSLSSVVLEAVKHHNALNPRGARPSELAQALALPIDSQRRQISTPIFQLPGTIGSICVKAVPDTGSSQDVIDKNLVESLFPSTPVYPVDESTDKLLVAPDREPITCIGKVFLSWTFKDENEKHHRWFYIVENCSKSVIIGNGFLRQTETMSKHRRRLEVTKPSDTDSPPNYPLSKGVHEARQDECLRQLVLGRIDSTDTLASLDTGCEANLMSIEYAKSLEIVILPLPSSEQHVKYVDGRRGSILGQVEVDWSFVDTPEKATKVSFYVLQTCVYPVIFGERFIFSEDPWLYHEAALSDVASETAMIGVVGLEKIRRLWGLIGSYKPDPQEEVKYMERKAKKDRAKAMLAQAQSTPQPQQQTQTQPPAVPQPAVLAPSNPTAVP